MIYKLHVKTALVICFVIFGLVGCKQGQQGMSIPMKAGEYEISRTRVSNGVQRIIESSKKCYNEPFFDPFKKYHENEKCKVTNVNKSAEKVSFDIDCERGKGTQAKGSVEYSVTGDKLDWSNKVNSNSDQDTGMETIGTGKYLGECK